jgi:hypothetical protein
MEAKTSMSVASAGDVVDSGTDESEEEAAVEWPDTASILALNARA